MPQIVREILWIITLVAIIWDTIITFIVLSKLRIVDKRLKVLEDGTTNEHSRSD